jgi:hypothetical protein
MPYGVKSLAARPALVFLQDRADHNPRPTPLNRPMEVLDVGAALVFCQPR